MSVSSPPSSATVLDTEFNRGLGLYDSTMVVVGSMIGSGIFIVSADMARNIGSPGWLLGAWLLTGALTVVGALSYGELAAMMPRAGGQYVYLREAFSPLWGFLYGWTLFLVIQTGTIAAVAVGFARYFGALVPWISDTNYIVPPVHISTGYALSLSTTQLVGLAMIALLTWTNTRGLEYGKIIQNVFTTAKTGALVGLIVVGLLLGWNHAAVADNFGNLWTPRGIEPIVPGLTALTAFGLFVAICVSQTGSLFSSDAWNNITFTAGEVKDPRRNIPLSLALGTFAVIGLYLLANVAYLVTLPFAQIQHAPADRVATATLNAIFPGLGATIMAIGIMISTFGCVNGLVLAGARAYYAMARDGLFFRRAGVLNDAKVPGWGLMLEGVWAAFLVLPRTYDPATHAYGNLYNNLLDYVISAALIFYILTIAGIFRLRRTRPQAERPYRAIGYPIVPALYIVGAAAILLVLFVYRTATTWPGLIIVLLGVPVYFAWKPKRGSGVLSDRSRRKDSRPRFRDNRRDSAARARAGRGRARRHRSNGGRGRVRLARTRARNSGRPQTRCDPRRA
jgi:basic amino acid/polyamine antiporter, APA family